MVTSYFNNLTEIEKKSTYLGVFVSFKMKISFTYFNFTNLYQLELAELTIFA